MIPLNSFYSDILLYPMDRSLDLKDPNKKLDIKEIKHLLNAKKYKSELKNTLGYDIIPGDESLRSVDFVGRVISVYYRVNSNDSYSNYEENVCKIMGGCAIFLNYTTVVTSKELVKPNVTINGIEYALEGVFVSKCKNLVYNHVYETLDFKRMKKAKVIERRFHPIRNDPNDPTGLLVDGFVFLQVSCISPNIEVLPIGIPSIYPKSENFCNVVGYPIVKAQYQMKWESIQENNSSLISYSQPLTFNKDERTVFSGGHTIQDYLLHHGPLYLGFNEIEKPIMYNQMYDSHPSFLVYGTYPSFIGMTGSSVSATLDSNCWTFHSIHLGFVINTDLFENIGKELNVKPFKKMSVAIRVDSLPFMMEYASLISEDLFFARDYRDKLAEYFSKNRQLLIDHFPKLDRVLFGNHFIDLMK